jgi:hypothetical protein
MLIELAQHVVADAKAREAEGDCPSPRRYSAEQVEAALVTVADALLAAEAERDALREALAEAQAAEAYQRGKVAAAARVIERFRNERELTARALTEKNNG